MFKFLKYINAKEWCFLGICLLFIIFQVWLDLELPKYMAKITGLVVQPSGASMTEIWIQGGYMMLCAFGSLATAVVLGFVMAKVGSSFSKRVRSALYNKVDSFSASEINRFSTASLITRSTNDVGQVQMFVTMGLQVMVKAPILAVWAMIEIAGTGFEWTLAMGIAVAVIISVLSVLFALVIPRFKKMQKLIDNINKVTREQLLGMPVVRAYNAENYQEAKFEKANKELTGVNLFTSRIMALASPYVQFIMMILTLSVYIIGAVIIDSAAIADKVPMYSNMVVFSAYAMMVIMAFMMMGMLAFVLPRAVVASKRINEVLDIDPAIKDGTVTAGETLQYGEVEFKNVSFKYPGAADYILKDINLSVKHGETVAFIGSTGSGKSTLINLIPRFFDPSEGEVLVDGVNVKDYKLDSLYGKLGYVSQKAVMFSGTVTSNVALGTAGKDEVSEERLKKAVKITQGTSFIEKMENKYDSEIARDGKNISGGQKQRLSIARAVYKDPEIYLFDDCFSALDYKTDKALRAALKKETKEATCIMIAQRIGTIIDADKIVVLDEGKVVGIGTHKELLKGCKVYKEIAMSQLSEEELAK